MFRLIPVLGLVLGLAACANGQRDLEKQADPLGDFKLGHAAVVAPNIVKGPVSREASPEEWIDEVDAAIEERFRRYDGEKFYHLGISIEGYVLAQPGLPLVYTPKLRQLDGYPRCADRARGVLKRPWCGLLTPANLHSGCPNWLPMARFRISRSTSASTSRTPPSAPSR